MMHRAVAKYATIAGLIISPSLAAAQPTVATQPAEHQAAQQLRQAGVKACLGMSERLTRSVLLPNATYAAMSTWKPDAPDAHMASAIIGEKSNQRSVATISGVFVSPSPGGCDGAAMEVSPTTKACAPVQTDMQSHGWKLLANLASAAPTLVDASGTVRMILLSAPSSGCVVISLVTGYGK